MQGYEVNRICQASRTISGNRKLSPTKNKQTNNSNDELDVGTTAPSSYTPRRNDHGAGNNMLLSSGEQRANSLPL